MTKTITGSLLTCAGAALFAAGALLFNHGSPPVATAPPIDATAARVEISHFSFSSVTVAPSAIVTVTNHDGDTHTLTARQGTFDTGPLTSGAHASFTAPAAPGTYRFACAIHPSMQGQLIVGTR